MPATAKRKFSKRPQFTLGKLCFATPLMNKTEFKPDWPIQGLPSTIKAFTILMHKTNQSPLPMCAMSALAACTLTVQGLIKVKWRNAPPSPVGQIFVLEAVSGERKTANDQMALEEHRRFDKEQADLEYGDEEAHRVDLSVWSAKRKQLNRALRRATERGGSTETEEAAVKMHEQAKPQLMKRPRMLISNITAPAIPRHLGEKYPFAGLFADEGGVALSSGALSDPAMINTIWDSGAFLADRIVRGRLEVHGASLTVFLQVQPGVLTHFLSHQGKLTHESGNSSRWLYANPASTQGQRTLRFIDLPSEAGVIYSARVRELLALYKGSKLPRVKVKHFTDAALELLAWFADAIERELAGDGHFALMRGAAGKAVEICARLAAVMHEFEGLGGDIGVDIVRGAIMIVAWHLNEYRMRFAARTQDEIDALDLEDCITRNVHRWKNAYVSGPVLCRWAPRRMRQRDKLRKVLATLEAEGKLKVWEGPGPQWNVALTYWAPVTPASPPSQNSATAFGAARYWNQGSPAAQASPPAPPPDTYELWPDVFLPPIT